MKKSIIYSVAFVVVLTLLIIPLFFIGNAAAQTGSILTQFVPGAPCATGNGRGMAFDGTDLYYTITGNPNIYKVDIAGNCLGSITVGTGTESRGGPLAWDGSALWTMDYAANSFILYRVNPTTGAIISSCDIATQNPLHPAVTNSPRNIGEYPDGLDWTGSTLWASSELFPGNWVVEVDTNCNILNAFNPVVKGGSGPSGVAFDGVDLWHAYPIASQLVQTDVVGVETGLSFPGLVHEDLACDGTTFPVAALWANQATFGSNLIRAYEIPRCEKEVKVSLDIKPQSCPNPLNINSKGVLPVAILGDEEFDVTDIDPASIKLAGVDPIRNSVEDVGSPLLDNQDECECTTEGADGYADLTLKFDTQEIVDALGAVADGDELVLTLTGNLLDGTPITGEDCIVVLSKGKNK